jgi:hypothetical protein
LLQIVAKNEQEKEQLARPGPGCLSDHSGWRVLYPAFNTGVHSPKEVANRRP